MCAGGLAALSLLGTAAAQSGTDVGPDDYLTVLPFYISPDDDRSTDGDGVGIALGYGRQLSGGFYWEGQFFADILETDLGPQTDYYQYGLGLDLTYRFFRDAGVSPFVLAGAGAVHNDVLPDRDDGTDAYANLGLGFLTRELTDGGLRIRGDARYIHDTFETGGNDGMSDWRVGIGFQVPLGRRVVEREVVREKVVKRTVPVEIVDSDGDGVPDKNDDCPDTLEGLATDNRGCAAKGAQTLRLEGVTFELNSARLTAQARRTLQRVADAMRSEPSLRAEIAGHTDATGNAAYNQRLSQQRAQAVRAFLVSKGIDADRLRARGYGESQPVASNATEEGRRANRRVEFRVID
ncbi:OmpA family protein [Salinisphaera sp. PC39]|uniref:OmpA family protein n=1 Tax=Salinisphaera sp. PC39 TaxID=1304156 RepID=UPI003340BF56